MAQNRQDPVWKRHRNERTDQCANLSGTEALGINGHLANDHVSESGTDDGPESPDSVDAKASSQHMKKKSATKASAHDGNSTTESTPDKRECRCELCCGASTSSLPRFFSEDDNRHVNEVPDTDSESETSNRADGSMPQVNGISSDEGIPRDSSMFDVADAEHFINGNEDGMENYFRENLHLLEHENLSNGASTPEAGPRNESLLSNSHVNGVTSWGVGDYVTMTCSSSRHSGMQSSNGYGSDKGSHRSRGSDYDSDEGGVYVLPDDLIACSKSKHTILNDSSEDQGDFIEADIPKNPYACSGDSSNSDSRRNSVSSSYEDLRQSNICPPNSANRTSTDEESFTKLVFDHRESQAPCSSNQRPEQLRASHYSYHSPNLSVSSVRPMSVSNAPVLRPTNLFDNHLQNEPERNSVMFTSASTESSSPFAMSSAAFMSSPYSDNSNSALNAPTSESSVFISPDRETPSASGPSSLSAAARRRESFLRNQSMDNPSSHVCQCPLRPAKSSGDLEHAPEEQEEFCSVHSAAITMSRSLHQNLSRNTSARGRYGTAATSAALMCRHCNKQHGGGENSVLRRSGSAGVSVVEGNEQSQVVLPEVEVNAQRSNSEELLDRDSCPQIVCISCHRRRFGTFSCDRNDCDVLETAQRKHEFCLHGRCTCSLSYYFHCVMDTKSDPGSLVEARSNSSQSNVYVRPRVVNSATVSQNKLSQCNQHTNNLSRRMHHYIHHLHNIGNGLQLAASNYGSDENNYTCPPRTDEESNMSSHSGVCSSSGSHHLGNVPEVSREEQSVSQENENNDNIENRRAMLQNQVVGACNTTSDPQQRYYGSDGHSRYFPGTPHNTPTSPQSSSQLNSVDEQLQRDRERREIKSRDGVDYVQRGPRSGGGIRIIPLLLRSSTTIDEMDPEAVMELTSMLQNDEESEDDGYVDFQKILKEYMVHKFYEKHSVASQWYRCDLESHDQPIEPAMIWTEYQAYLYHERQIGVSACGATAAINVLKAFDLKVEQEAVCAAIKTNQRDESAAVPDYLLSRSIAGTTASRLIHGVQTVSQGQVYGRFFHMHPMRRVCIRQFLSEWIKKGAVPLVTLNLQRAVPSGYEVPDAWHHQMVFGVSQQGVYLTNPQEIVPEHVLMEQLSSEPVLLIQRKDVISRWRTEGCDLRLLMTQADPRWRTLNVIGQIVNVMREEKLPHHMGFRPQLTEFIRIPAWYRAGVTLFMRKDNVYYKHLSTMPEFEIRSDWKKKRKQGKT